MVQDAFWYQGMGYGRILFQEAGSSSHLSLLYESKCPAGIPRQLGFLDFFFHHGSELQLLLEIGIFV